MKSKINIKQPLLIFIQIQMQQDPQFKDLVRKSFILQKVPNLQIPLVKKQTLFKHELITTLTVSTCIHLAIYPFDTIKNRTIAKNSKLDVGFFTKNNTATLTTYLGITRGYASILISNICHLLIGKDNLLLGAGVQGLLKTWIDMSKINKQMGNEKGDMSIMKKSFLPCAFFGILRDVVFRTSYVALSSYFHKIYLANSRFYDERKRVNNLFLSTIIATVISHPFDVCFVKAASQRIYNYTGILETPKQIIRQDGFSKVLIGGLWARLAYNLLSTMILANTYEPFSNAVLQAF